MRIVANVNTLLYILLRDTLILCKAEIKKRKARNDHTDNWYDITPNTNYFPPNKSYQNNNDLRDNVLVSLVTMFTANNSWY